MDFTAKEDINATIEEVFAILSDMDMVERQALRRGIDVRRITSHDAPAPGMQWQADFRFRGRKRSSEVTLAEFEPPRQMVFTSRTGGLHSKVTVDVMELSKVHTRVTVQAELMPQTLSARLLVQSMKLARTKINRKFAIRMAQFARDIEERAARLP